MLVRTSSRRHHVWASYMSQARCNDSCVLVLTFSLDATVRSHTICAPAEAVTILSGCVAIGGLGGTTWTTSFTCITGGAVVVSNSRTWLSTTTSTLLTEPCSWQQIYQAHAFIHRSFSQWCANGLEAHLLRPDEVLRGSDPALRFHVNSCQLWPRTGRRPLLSSRSNWTKDRRLTTAATHPSRCAASPQPNCITSLASESGLLSMKVLPSSQQQDVYTR